MNYTDSVNENVENLILEHLKRFHASQDRIESTLRELVVRIGHVETELAHVHTVIAEQSVRLDRLNARVERIEFRLELAPN